MSFRNQDSRIAIISREANMFHVCDWHHVFTWKIPNLSLIPHEVDHVVQSPLFHFENASWIIKMYLHGQTEYKTEGNMDLIIENLNSSCHKLVCKMYLKNALNETFNHKSLSFTFDSQWRFTRVHRFMSSHDALELKDPFTLVLKFGTEDCLVKSAESSFENEVSVNKENRNNEIGEIFKRCLTFKSFWWNVEGLAYDTPADYHVKGPLFSFANAMWILKVLSCWTEHSSERNTRVVLERLHSEISDHNVTLSIHSFVSETTVNGSYSFNSSQTQAEVLNFSSESYLRPICALGSYLRFVVEMEIKNADFEAEIEEVKKLSTAELNKTDDTSKVDGSDETEASGPNQTDGDETDQLVSLSSQREESDLVTDVKDLLKEERGIDVTFVLETLNSKTQFFAHQLILALRSSYFADVFYGQGRNKEHQFISLKEINPKAFEQMIKYCYDYEPCLTTIENACALFKVASEFKVLNLQNLCHTFFSNTKIEPGNVFGILKISEEMEDESLKGKCYKILQEKTTEVLATYGLRDITPAMVHTILHLPKMSLNSEFELIKLLFDWAKMKSQDEDSSSKNAREYLENMLQYMDFLALTFEEFATLCRDNQDFFSSDEIANVSLNIAFFGAREMPEWYNKDLKSRVYTGSNE